MGRIVWLASYPKSGNTWLRFFLYGYFNKEALENGAIDINAQSFRNMFAQDSARQWFEPHLAARWEDANELTFAGARQKSQADIAASTPSIGFVKTHSILGDWLGTPTIHPHVTAGAIYIVRNPLDIVPSVKPHWSLTSLDEAIRRMANGSLILKQNDRLAPTLLRSWSDHVSAWIGQPREGIAAIRYEDMLADPEKVFSFVVGFLGHKPDAKRINLAIEACSFEKLAFQEKKSGFFETPREGTQFFRQGKQSGWKATLNEKQVRRVVKDHRAMMERFGYLPDKFRKR